MLYRDSVRPGKSVLKLHVDAIQSPVHYYQIIKIYITAGRPGSSEVPRNPLTRWDVSSIPANGIFLTKKLKNKNKNAQRVEND